MSKQQHLSARIDGLKGPLYPAEIDGIYSPLDRNGDDLARWGKQIPFFVGLMPLSTTDDYWWFSAMYFVFPNGEVILAIPWAQDWDQQDGTQDDRSPAIYVRGEVSDDQIRKILVQLGETLPAAG